MYLGCTQPVPQPVPALWPLMQVDTVHSLEQEKALGTQHGLKAL